MYFSNKYAFAYLKAALKIPDKNSPENPGIKLATSITYIGNNSSKFLMAFVSKGSQSEYMVKITKPAPIQRSFTTIIPIDCKISTLQIRLLTRTLL